MGIRISFILSVSSLLIGCGTISLSPLPDDSEFQYFSLQNPSELVKVAYIPEKNSPLGSQASFPKRMPGFAQSKLKPSRWSANGIPILTHRFHRDELIFIEKYFYLNGGDQIEWEFSGNIHHKIRLADSFLKEISKWSLYCNDSELFSEENLKPTSIVECKKNDSQPSKLILKNKTKDPVFIPNIHLIPVLKDELELKLGHKPPNILFIVIDSFRFEVLGRYNATPFLDEFQKDAIGFNRHMVNSAWTRPSTTIFFTGKYASESPLNLWDYPLSKEEVEDFYNLSEPLPFLLSRRGYYTQMIGNNPFVDSIPTIGVDFGFHRSTDFSLEEEDTENITKYFLDNQKKLLKYPDQNKPYFLFLNYNDPHRPYTPPEKYRNQLKLSLEENMQFSDKRKDYLGEVAYVDDNIKQIIQSLKKQNLYDDTFIIITSDHGEVMDPKHAFSPFSETYTLYGHGQGLYEEDIHVPLLIKFPKESPLSVFHGSSTNLLTRSIDIMPTILRELKMGIPESVKGLPIQSLLLGEDKSPREYYGETRGTKAYKSNQYKLIQKTYEFHRLGTTWEGEQKPEVEYFFDLSKDPLEHNPLINPDNGLVAYSHLRQKLDSVIAPKSYYGIRINQKDLLQNYQSGILKIQVSIPHGSYRNVIGLKSFPTWSLRTFPRGMKITLDLNDFKARENEFFFQVYPDVSEPKFDLFLDGLPLSPKKWGVGSFDLNPVSCLGKECKALILSNDGIPPSVNEFRVQIWKVGSVASTLVDRKKMENQAMEALQKQGYVD